MSVMPVFPRRVRTGISFPFPVAWTIIFSSVSIPLVSMPVTSRFIIFLGRGRATASPSMSAGFIVALVSVSFLEVSCGEAIGTSRVGVVNLRSRRPGSQIAHSFSGLSFFLALECCIVIIGFLDQVSQKTCIWFWSISCRSGLRSAGFTEMADQSFWAYLFGRYAPRPSIKYLFELSKASSVRSRVTSSSSIFDMDLQFDVGELESAL